MEYLLWVRNCAEYIHVFFSFILTIPCGYGYSLHFMGEAQIDTMACPRGYRSELAGQCNSEFTLQTTNPNPGSYLC